MSIARSILLRAGVGTAPLDARILLADAMQVAEEHLMAAPEQRLTLEEAKRFADRVARRRDREPVAHITGRKEFWSLDFNSPPGVLIPRPDTETLVEDALNRFQENPPRHILDFGTGTGCLLIALLCEFRRATGVGIDISELAVSCARDNARRHGLSDRTRFAVGDWKAPMHGEFDLIVANPPYIEDGDRWSLEPEIREFEPESALFGGSDGLDAYKQIVKCVPSCLTESGVLILEIGAGQAQAVGDLIKDQAAHAQIAIRTDLAGRERCLTVAFSQRAVGQCATEAQKTIESPKGDVNLVVK